MQEKVFKNEKIQILWNTEAIELVGEKLLSGVWTINNKTQEKVLIECAGVFYAIGHTPNPSLDLPKQALKESSQQETFKIESLDKLSPLQELDVWQH